VVDFLIVVTELFFRYLLRSREAEICRSRHISEGVGHFERKFQMEGCIAHQPLLMPLN